MGARTRRLLPIVAALLAVAGCDFGGEDDAPSTTEAPAPQRQPSSTGTTPESEAAPRGVRLALVGRFDQPTYLAAPRGDGRRFVVEREGRIRVLRGRRILESPFLDIGDLVTTDGEGGLLSMAFARDYPRSGRFYVYYTDSDGYLRIDGFRRSSSSPDRADPASGRLIMRVPHQRSNHKGGQLQIGPDGNLYAGFGDGGGGGDPDDNGQDLSQPLAKLIRIAPRPGGGYDVPPDNPFRGRAGALPETYAYGLRNPYRFSFDRVQGALTIGDVGQDAVEEIDYVPNPPARARAGRAPRGGYNFGWSVFEGDSRYRDGDAPGARGPALTHSHADGYCSITGGYVIRDRSLGPALYGRYVYGDYCNGGLRVAALRPGGARSRELGPSVSGLASFGEDGRGGVYAISLEGPVYRLAPRP